MKRRTGKKISLYILPLRKREEENERKKKRGEKEEI
jgi:hypothetical protein